MEAGREKLGAWLTKKSEVAKAQANKGEDIKLKRVR
jgi:hypothetical protein